MLTMTMKVKKKSGRYFGDGGGRKSGLRPRTKSNPWELALQISSCTTRNNWYNFLQLGTYLLKLLRIGWSYKTAVQGYVNYGATLCLAHCQHRNKIVPNILD